MGLAEAIVQARRGEPEGFSALFEQTVPKVWLAANLLGCEQPERALVRIYTRAFALIDTLPSPSDLRVWLGRISYAVLTQSEGPGKNLPALFGEQGEALKLLAALPKEERTAVLLLCADGCSAAQASDILGVPEIEIKRAMRRARQHLTAGMQEKGSAQSCKTDWLIALMADTCGAMSLHREIQTDILRCALAGEDWPELEIAEEPAKGTLATPEPEPAPPPEKPEAFEKKASARNPLVQPLPPTQPSQPEEQADKGGFFRRLFRGKI